MEIKRVNCGKLRAIGYEPRERTLRVELDDGSKIDDAGVGDDVWRRLSTSASAWSYYRDNIEEEFSGHRAAASPPTEIQSARRTVQKVGISDKGRVRL